MNRRQDAEDTAAWMAIVGIVFIMLAAGIAIVKGEPLALVVAGGALVYMATAELGGKP